MKRLLLVAAFACRAADHASEANPMPNRVSEVTTQRNPSRLVVAGARIALLGIDQVTLTDAKTGRAVTVKLPGARSIGVLGNDVAVGVRDDKTGKTALVRFAPGDDKGVRSDGLLVVPTRGTARIAAAASPGELYMTEEKQLARLRVDPDRIVPVQSVTWDRDELRTFTPAWGGRVAYEEADHIVVLGPGDQQASFALHGDWVVPTHVAAGPRDATLWITADDRLALATLANAEAQIGKPVALPSPAYHLASAGDFAAVLVAHGAGKFEGEVVAVGADGAVRWHAKLPELPSTDAYIAASTDIVAVAAGDRVFAWHAATGAPAH